MKKLILSVLCIGLLFSTIKTKTASAAEYSTIANTTNFTLEHVNSAKIIGCPGSVDTYQVSDVDFLHAEKIKKGDILENCLILFERPVETPAIDNHTYLYSEDNSIEFTGETTADALTFSSSGEGGSVYGSVSGDYQLVYVNGYFGEVIDLVGSHYYYDESAYKLENVAAGDKIIGTKFYWKFDGTATNRIKHSNLELLYYMEALSASAFGDPPQPVEQAYYRETRINDGYIIELVAPFETFGYSINEKSVIDEVSGDVYKLVEFHNAEKNESAGDVESSDEESKTFFDTANDWVNDKLGLGLSAGAFGTVVLVIALFLIVKPKK